MANETPTQDPQEVKPPIFVIPPISDLPDEYIALKTKVEIASGVGSQYSVPTSSYAAFKAAVNGKGFDIDNYYGWQCWDGAALLWQQFGLALVTGNGLAIGCWDLKRDVNKYDKFDLVGKIESLKLGDVVCMRPNHIGFFDGFDGAYMRILGQNQGGTPHASGGSAFNLARISKSAFAGAFRLKKWGTSMVTNDGLYRITRFYLGRDPSAAEVKKYVGNVTDDQAAAAINSSKEYNDVVAALKGANKGVKLAVMNHLPARLRG